MGSYGTKKFEKIFSFNFEVFIEIHWKLQKKYYFFKIASLRSAQCKPMLNWLILRNRLTRKTHKKTEMQTLRLCVVRLPPNLNHDTFGTFRENEFLDFLNFGIVWKLWDSEGPNPWSFGNHANCYSSLSFGARGSYRVSFWREWGPLQFAGSRFSIFGIPSKIWIFVYFTQFWQQNGPFWAEKRQPKGCRAWKSWKLTNFELKMSLWLLWRQNSGISAAFRGSKYTKITHFSMTRI